MSIANDIDNESIWMSFWRRHRTQVANREDLIRRDRNRRDEEEDGDHERQMLAEQHEQDMKVIAEKKQVETRQALADRRAGQDALQAWRAGLNDRRDY